MAEKVEIVEVGPRDGLQNEAVVLDMSTRLKFAQKLDQAGVKRIELGAFVSPDWVPQMAGTPRLMKKAMEQKKKGTFSRGVRLSALVPNLRGMEEAMDIGVREVAVFTGVSETFVEKNINCSVKESFRRFEMVAELAQKNKVKLRGYLSTCFGCPYEGKISEAKVLKTIEKFFKLGIHELSIGDTIGVATPDKVHSLLKKMGRNFDKKKIAMHFHDTRGTALANILASLDRGIRVFDSSLGGLGGCPYAPGASGNVATEDVVYMLHGMGFRTGINLEELIKINHWMTTRIQHSLPSRVGLAGLPKT